MILHIFFGKSSGCTKCAALKRKVDVALENNPDIKCRFHDILTEDGLVEFCKLNINPNRVPALVASDDSGRWLEASRTTDDVVRDKSLLYPNLGICTDYSDDGRRGIITTRMIEDLISEGMPE